MKDENEKLVAELHDARRRFLELVADVRPELHRYCARMLGSVADGEDVVQDTLVRAYYALAELDELPSLRPWLFQIAQNRALDHLRRYDRRMRDPMDTVEETAVDAGPDPEDAFVRQEAVGAAVSRFVELGPLQRSCVILKDVLGHSLEEIAGLLELSVAAVKSALHRGRVRLHALNERAAAEPPQPRREPSEAAARYARMFNARDWDGVRAMLAEDVQLDVVSASQRAGRRAVGTYFSNYSRRDDWHLAPAWLDGREVLAVFRAPSDERPSYFIQLTFADGRLTSIRDFRYVPYIAADARFTIA